jgi:deoxyinosine 3'endonuclease (endonuclease V)
MQSLTVVYQDFTELDLTIPYRSGFLGFREVPAYSTLLSRLEARCQQVSGPTGEPRLEGITSLPEPSVACRDTFRSEVGTPVWPQMVLVDGFGVLHQRRWCF